MIQQGPETSPTRFVATGDGRIAYDSRGEGAQTLVLVHGMGDSRASWSAVAVRLAAAGNRVLTIDLRGHGESDATFADYSPEATVEDVVAVLRAEGLSGVHLVGNSYSGATAVLVAAHHPERVASVVLANPFVHDVPADRWMRPLMPVLFARPWGPWVWSRYYRTLLPTRPGDLGERARRARVHMGEPGRIEAMRAMGRASKAGVEAELGQVAQPALVLMGGADPDYPDPGAEGAWVAERLGGSARVQVMADVGHYPFVERPEATAEALLSHVRGVEHAA